MKKIRITNSKAKEESLRYRCPKCGASKFCATAHVTQDWQLDESGRYEKTINDFVETTHYPDEDDIWDCDRCDFSAPGSEFRVHETNSAIDKEQELRNVLYTYPLDKYEVDDIIRATDIKTANKEDMRIKHIYECTADLGEAYLQDKMLDARINDVVDRDKLGNHLVDSMDEFLLLNSGRIVQFEI